MLTDVTIEGLRGVGRVELHFVPEQRVHVLFGANGVGKTKCLEALYQFLLASNRDFSNLAMKNPWAVMTRMRSESDEMAFSVSEQENSICIWKMWGKKDKDLSRMHDLPVVFLGAGQRASLGDVSGNAGVLGSFKDRRGKYLRAIQQAFQYGHLNSLGMAGDTRAWFLERAQSVNPYQESSDNRKVEIDAVLSMLHGVEPNIDPEFMQVDGAGQVFLRVREEKRELGELSSGFAALLKMVQAIIAGYAAFTNEVQLQNVRGIVLIDEIDAHLHPAWQAKIIPCLKDLLPNTTFYIATHSPLALTLLKDGEAYRLERGEDGVVKSRVVEGTSRRLFVDMLESAFGVNTNELKRRAMDEHDQTEAKRRLLELLEATREAKV